MEDLQNYKKELSELQKMERDLVVLIAFSGNTLLMEKYNDYQNQKNKTNEELLKFLVGSKTKADVTF
jgi:hypothetical protein